MKSAGIVISSKSLTVDEISKVMRCQPDIYQQKGEIRGGARVPIPASSNSWELRESVSLNVSIERALELLMCRIIPLEESLHRLSQSECELKLSLVQWISELDEAGPGFSLGLEEIRFLAKIGAFLDVDQYVG